MRMPRSRSRCLAVALVAVTACVLPCLYAGGEATSIKGRLTDDCDGLVPVNGWVVFELIDLRCTSGGATAEWPEGEWIVEWSLDRRTWTTPATQPSQFGGDRSALRFLVGAKRLIRTGPLTVYARASVAAKGRTLTAPVTFSHTVQVVGIGPMEYSTDAGQTWAEVPDSVEFGIGQSVVYRVVPVGVELFPAGAVSWRYDTGSGPQWAQGEQLAVTYNTFSQSVQTPYRICAYLGRAPVGRTPDCRAALARTREALRSGVLACRMFVGNLRESRAGDLCRSASVSAREVLALLVDRFAGEEEDGPQMNTKGHE